jgi:3-isopropylmalate dehydrogenase
MWMVKNPEWFDVLVTGNMFGDIITDLGAMTQGGMGLVQLGRPKVHSSVKFRIGDKLPPSASRVMRLPSTAALVLSCGGEKCPPGPA